MTDPKRALITGITGQDGSYMAELLLEKGYEVHGVVRRSSSFNTARIDHLHVGPHDEEPRLFVHYGDLTDPVALTRLVDQLRPDEIYHLGSQSDVRVSFDLPALTFDVTANGTLRLLQAVREAGLDARFLHASSSEMFGAAAPPQSETTPFHPRSPYGVAKAAAHWAGINYREAYGAFVSNAIMFNHESPRRGDAFVTRKISRAVARIGAGLQETLHLGNLEARRDWGYAPDYVEAMWRLLQADHPSDVVLATGESHSVRDFAERAFAHAGLDHEGRIEIDPRYYRPSEVDDLVGDASLARELIGWEPRVRFDELVGIMVDADVESVERQLAGHAEHREHEQHA
jgi:GDPmannose 4,6-dehydratase